MTAPLPTGTVTFLFTDIEGSTRRWEDFPDAMPGALSRHDALLRAAIGAQGGRVFKTVGDAFCAAFPTAPDALAAAVAAQRALEAEDWVGLPPIRVRMALNTGAADERDGDYFGPALNRVARLLAAGHGGQVLVSDASASLLRDALPEGVALDDLGEHQLRDLGRRQRVFQARPEGEPAEFPALRSVDAMPNNLPVALTSFIGREAEIARIQALLAEHRLVTLTGVGGTGKTRLALQAGAELLDRYEDGVWLVPLAERAEPEQLPAAVASALRIRLAPQQDPLDALVGALSSKQLLLLLDNCEHLIQACAELGDALLRRAPRLTILATSREGLGIAGEQFFPVSSLPLPPASGADPESLLRSPSVRLFIERARGVRAEFALSPENAEAVVEVCRRLDGIPLAIELAAARVRILPPEKLAERLDQRFRILTGGSRTALPRQQTLAATIDWSYDLLEPAEQHLLQRLAVFRGGCTLEAAERVCAGDPIEDWEVLDRLSRLVDKSLVLVRGSDESPRYRLLETIRQYALDKLAASGASGALRTRHLEHFADEAKRRKAEAQGPGQAGWLTDWRAELPNVRAALDWARATEAWRPAMTIVLALWDLWVIDLAWAEAQPTLHWLLASDVLPPGSLERARVLEASAASETVIGNVALAVQQAEELVAISQRLQRIDLELRAQTTRINMLLSGGEKDRAEALALEVAQRMDAIEGAGVHGIETLAWLRMRMNFLHARLRLAWRRREWEDALRLNRQLVAIAREAERDDWVAKAVLARAQSLLFQGDAERALPVYQEARERFEALGMRVNVANLDLDIAAILAQQGKHEEAESLYRHSLTVSGEHGHGMVHAEALVGLATLAVRRGELDEARRKALASAKKYREVGSEKLAVALVALAHTELLDGRTERGCRLFGAGLARIPHADPSSPWWGPCVAELETARATLGDEVVEAAIAEGRAMSSDEALAYARGQRGADGTGAAS